MDTDLNVSMLADGSSLPLLLLVLKALDCRVCESMMWQQLRPGWSQWLWKLHDRRNNLFEKQNERKTKIIKLFSLAFRFTTHVFFYIKNFNRPEQSFEKCNWKDIYQITRFMGRNMRAGVLKWLVVTLVQPVVKLYVHDVFTELWTQTENEVSENNRNSCIIRSFFFSNQTKNKLKKQKTKNRLVKQASISRKKLLPHDPAQD